MFSIFFSWWPTAGCASCDLHDRRAFLLMLFYRQEDRARQRYLSRAHLALLLRPHRRKSTSNENDSTVSTISQPFPALCANTVIHGRVNRFLFFALLHRMHFFSLFFFLCRFKTLRRWNRPACLHLAAGSETMRRPAGLAWHCYWHLATYFVTIRWNLSAPLFTAQLRTCPVSYQKPSPPLIRDLINNIFFVDLLRRVFIAALFFSFLFKLMERGCNYILTNCDTALSQAATLIEPERAKELIPSPPRPSSLFLLEGYVTAEELAFHWPSKSKN